MSTTTTMDLNESSFARAVAEGLTVVDFWAPWCGPCRMQAPALDALAESGVRVAKVNVEQAPMLAGQFRVQAIPLLVLMKDGREVDRLVGLHQADDLRQWVARHE